MADEQMSIGGLSTDFTFTLAPMTVSSESDAQDMMKSSVAHLRGDGPDVKASGHTGATTPDWSTTPNSQRFRTCGSIRR